MNNVLVSVKNLEKNYRTGDEVLRILRGLDFEMERGISVSITGSSGSGKSTLLNILGGMDNFDGGSCVVSGRDLSKANERVLSQYRRVTVGLIFQFHYLLNDFTALENVMMPAYIAGAKKKAAIEKARALLDEVRMADRLSHYPAKLSGGERQRVAVARALINDPELILADEPTGNLDEENGIIVAELLYESARRHGKSLIIVTHDEATASSATRRLRLEDGVLKPVSL